MRRMGQILLECKSVFKDDSVLVSKKFLSNLEGKNDLLHAYIWRDNLSHPPDVGQEGHCNYIFVII